MRRTASSALAASTTALNTRHVRLMLLHRVQRQREQRRLLDLESLSDPGTMSTVVRRMDALEQRVAADMQAMREMHHAQAEALAKLINRIEQLAAAPRLAALEAEWVSSVKKNLEIESACLQLEAECAGLRNAVELATSAPR